LIFRVSVDQVLVCTASVTRTAQRQQSVGFCLPRVHGQLISRAPQFLRLDDGVGPALPVAQGHDTIPPQAREQADVRPLGGHGLVN